MGREEGNKILKYLLVSVRAQPGCLVILLAVDVCTIVEGLIAPPHRPSSLLILEMPVEAGKGPVLLALVLQEQRTLVHTELLEVPATQQSGREKGRGNCWSLEASNRFSHDALWVWIASLAAYPTWQGV